MLGTFAYVRPWPTTVTTAATAAAADATTFARCSANADYFLVRTWWSTSQPCAMSKSERRYGRDMGGDCNNRAEQKEAAQNPVDIASEAREQ